MSTLNNLKRCRKTLVQSVILAFVIAGFIFLPATSANRFVNSRTEKNERAGWKNEIENPSGRAAKNPAKKQKFVGAANGAAFVLNENAGAVETRRLKTSMPVFKAFGLTSNESKLLYTPLRKGAPTGELYLENLTNGRREKISAKIVLEAAISPVDDDRIAYTFAGGESFGLAVARLDTNETRILLAGNVFTEKIQWSNDGKGIHYFATAAAEENLNLEARYAPLAAGETEVFSSPETPDGFPEIERIEPEKTFGGKSEFDDLIFGIRKPEIYGFRISAPDGKRRLTGENLLGSAAISVTDTTNGETKTLGTGQFIKALETGIVVKEFSPSKTELKFIDWRGSSEILAVSTVNYNLPLQNSTMIQGGVGYAPPGNCSITAHTGSMDFAYDFQSPTVGAHVMAAADGLVVYNTSSVACNTIDTDSCTDYSASGCPGTYLGNVVIIQHADGTFTKYAHMQLNSPRVAVGTNACQGLYIGRQGHTGSTNGTFNGCGDHLHFQRQTSPDIFGQAVSVDFTEAPSPLSCGANYASASTEIAHSIAATSQNFGIGGGTGNVNLTSTGCVWSATSNDNWITVTSAASGSGNAVVNFAVADNSGGSQRTGTMNLGGHIFTVTQAGVQPPNQPPTANAGSDQTITLPASATLSGAASDDGLPNGALTTTWSKLSGPGTVSFANANSLSTTASFSAAGVYVLRLTASDSSLSATDDITVTVNTNSGGGSLTGSQNATPASVNISTEGTADWAHWGLTTAASFNHKNIASPQIGNYTQIGSTSPLRYTNNSNTYTWTGGTPTASATNTTTGVYVYNVGSGFQITVPADTTSRTLKLYVGVWAAGGYLEAALSDGSASPFTDTSTISPGVYNGVYTLNYAAASAGQSLTIRWIVNSSTHPVGNVTLQAATLKVNGAPTPTPTPPANQPPTANAGSDQTITLPSNVTLSGTASDDGLPNGALTTTWSKLSGPGTVSFANANSLSTTASFSAAGVYVLRLTASDNSLSATDDLTVNVSSSGSGTGTISVTGANTPSNVNLTTEGAADWAHWGLTSVGSFNHKNTVGQKISNYTSIGSGAVQRYNNNPSAYSWSDGTPTASASGSAAGLYVIGAGNGFQITVPADTTQKTLKLYVGLWAAGGKLEVSLSDASAPVYIDTSLVNSTGTSNQVYSLNYQAASGGQTLTVKWTVNTSFNNWSNVTLQAAALNDGSTPTPATGEFQISSSVNSSQYVTHIASDANGNFIVVWHSSLQDGSGWGIFARRYNSAGVPLGNEFQVNTYTLDNQFVPRAAIDSNGNFTIVWESRNQDGSGYGIYAQRYNSSGAPVGGEFRINSTTANDQHDPFIAMTPNGNFVVVWVSDLQDGSAAGIFGRRFDASGVPLSGEFQVNSYTLNDQKQPAVAIDTNGNFAVVWESFGQDGSDKGVYAQRFSALAAAQGGEFKVNTFTAGEQSSSWISMTPTGDFVIVWSSAAQDGSGSGIYGQRYNAGGAAQGGEFQANTYTASDQIYATVAAAPNGDFLIAWESISQDGSGRGVYGQRYGAGGAPLSGEFQINNYTADNQFNPYLAADSNGNYIAAWISYGQDGSAEGIFGKRYDAAGNPL